jgi:histidyl-tRNA synthetase
MPKKKISKEKTAVKKTKKPVSNKATPARTDDMVERVTTKAVKTPSLLRGMKDILPKEGYVWRTMDAAASAIAAAYGFAWTDTPILEEANLFIRSIGRGTDVVDKEMYIFEDKDGTKVALRPEMTASVVRAYITHGLHNVSQPVKTWHIGPLFRHDRPQAGRYRQFHQFDCETIGERDPVLDAEIISVAYNFLRDLGIRATVMMNSIGTLADRERYMVELVGYLRSKRTYLSEESKHRLQKNPLRILDSKDENDRAVLEEAPQILDWLSEESKNYFMKVLEYLDEVEVREDRYGEEGTRI